MDLIPVTTLAQAQVVREIRNTCLMAMTNDRRVVSPEAQMCWWAALDKTRFKLYLWQEPLAPHVAAEPRSIGYGILRFINDERLWISYGLIPEARGAGRGARFFNALMAEARRFKTASEAVWAEVLESNAVALEIVKLFGFIERDRRTWGTETILILSTAPKLGVVHFDEVQP